MEDELIYFRELLDTDVAHGFSKFIRMQKL